MKRFLLGLAWCLLPALAVAKFPQCVTDDISTGCSVLHWTGVKHCSFYEQDSKNNSYECSPPAKYRDEDGNVHVTKDGEIIPHPKRSDKGGVLEKEPEKPSPTPAPSPRKCQLSGTAKARQGGNCWAGGWAFEGYRGGKVEYCTNGYEAPVMGPCPEDKPEDKPKPPKDKPKDKPPAINPDNGKVRDTPKPGDGKDDGHTDPPGQDGRDGKDGQDGQDGQDGGTGQHNGQGGSDGQGQGQGDGQGNGKGWWKGAGDGRIGDVRVPRGQGDGIGWRGDFFLRNANQCPQDKVLTLMGKQVVFSYTNICKYLDMISPIVKAICMFVAGMMVVRSIRAK